MLEIYENLNIFTIILDIRVTCEIGFDYLFNILYATCESEIFKQLYGPFLF